MHDRSHEDVVVEGSYADGRAAHGLHIAGVCVGSARGDDSGVGGIRGQEGHVLELALVGGVQHGHAHHAQIADALQRCAGRRDEVVVRLHRADLEHEPAALTECDEARDLGPGMSERLLGEDVLPGLESGGDDLAVRSGCEHEDGIDIGGRDHLMPVVRGQDVAGEACGDLGCEGCRGIAHRRHREVGAQRFEVGQVHGLADEAEADESDPNGRHGTASLPETTPAGALSCTGSRKSTLVRGQTTVLVSRHHASEHR